MEGSRKEETMGRLDVATFVGFGGLFSNIAAFLSSHIPSRRKETSLFDLQEGVEQIASITLYPLHPRMQIEKKKI